MAHLLYRLIFGIALACSATMTQADSATAHRVQRHNSQVHHGNGISGMTANRVPSNVFYVPSYVSSYVPDAYIIYPDTILPITRPAQGRRLIGVPPLVDPAAGVIDRKAWSWRPMKLGIAPGFPAYASDIRIIEPPAAALDGATFLADEVVYRLRGIDAPPPGAPGAEAARRRLDAVLASSERIVVYPVGLDYEQRMLADAVVGSTDLAALLRGR
jgi:endonuclease YncB( thermonuclease family)